MLAVAKRVKQYWQKVRKSLKTLEERDVEVLGKFAQGLMKEDLDDLDDKVKPMLIELLGKFNGLPEDKLEERAEFAYDFLKVSYFLLSVGLSGRSFQSCIICFPNWPN